VLSNHAHGELAAGGPGARLVTKYGGSVNVTMSADPQTPQAQQPFTITYTLKDKEGAPMTPDKLRVTHERIMHLIVVSQDLRRFSHVHPEGGDGGSYSVSETLPATGRYFLFNEFFNTDGSAQIDRHELSTVGAVATDAPAALTPNLGVPQEVEGLTVLMRAPQKVRRRLPANFLISVHKEGKPVTDLEPYLGAPMHVVLISADTKQFAHTHGDIPGGAMSSGSVTDMSAMPTPPARFGPGMLFNHTFMQEGFYRIWLQFGHQGKVVTVAYNVKVDR
jgi:hypothetical protein